MNSCASATRHALGLLTGAAFVLAVLLVSGCATTRVKALPNGQPGLLVDCSGDSLSWSHCYQKAGEVCPHGYAIIKRTDKHHGRFVAGDLFYLVGARPRHRELLIRCKALADPLAPAQG